MRLEKSQTGFTFVQVLAVGVIALAAVVSTGLPSLATLARQQENDPQHLALTNIRQIGLASLMYAGDYDDTMPLLINGSYRNMQDVKDGEKPSLKKSEPTRGRS